MNIEGRKRGCLNKRYSIEMQKYSPPLRKN